jgi:large subunit ribosomal protein L29
MKANKIRNMDLGEVERQAQDSQEQLFRFRFQMGMGQSEGLKKYRNLRKDRARLLTIMNEKRAAGETAAPVAAKGGKKKSKKS